MTTPEPTIRPTRYEICLLPENDINHHTFVLTVEHRGNDRWAVVHFNSCLGTDGTWDYGVKEYDRGDVWLDDHRFCLDDALRLAKEAAPYVIVNGRMALDTYHRTHSTVEGAQR